MSIAGQPCNVKQMISFTYLCRANGATFTSWINQHTLNVNLVTIPFLLHEICFSDDWIFKCLKNVSTGLRTLGIFCLITWKKWLRVVPATLHLCMLGWWFCWPIYGLQLHLLVPGHCARYFSRGVMKKTGWYGMVLLVPSTTFHNGNTKITILMCNELNWTEPA